MDIHTAERLNKAGIIMVYDFAVTKILGSDPLHFLISQPEIPDVDILLHSLHMDRFWNDRNAALGIPAERHLSRALSVLFTDLSQRCV